MVLTTEQLRATNINDIAMVNVQIRRQSVSRQQSKKKNLISVSTYQVLLHSKKLFITYPEVDCHNKSVPEHKPSRYKEA